jgi:glutamine phosphoribosylpyrophosphate amidotransferase
MEKRFCENEDAEDRGDRSDKSQQVNANAGASASANASVSDDELTEYDKYEKTFIDNLISFIDQRKKLSETAMDLLSYMDNRGISTLTLTRTNEVLVSSALSSLNIKLPFTGRCDHLDEVETRTCIICKDENKNIVLLPCRHFIFCEGCYLEYIQFNEDNSHLDHDPCPICSEKIDDAIKIYDG